MARTRLKSMKFRGARLSRKPLAKEKTLAEGPSRVNRRHMMNLQDHSDPARAVPTPAYPVENVSAMASSSLIYGILSIPGA